MCACMPCHRDRENSFAECDEQLQPNSHYSSTAYDADDTSSAYFAASGLASLNMGSFDQNQQYDGQYSAVRDMHPLGSAKATADTAQTSVAQSGVSRSTLLSALFDASDDDED